jgi:tetratricopeptide (TPR) repeat protein
MNQTSHTPDPEERQAIVFRALRELVQSDAFRRSARIIRFLEYVVLESLSSTPRLSERTIGIVVFDRAEDWDPKLDPIVRIEARRLREKLGQYYVSVPTEQAVILDLPKGGYRISFDWRAGPPVEAPTTPKEEDSEEQRSEQPLISGDRDFVTKPAKTSTLWTRRSFWLWIFSLALCIGLAAVTLSVSDYGVAEDRSIRIDSFRVGNDLNQELDGTAIAGKIADQIRQLQQNTRATWTPPSVEDSWTSQHGPSWSSKIETSLRALARPQDERAISTTEVSGAIENSGANAVSLYIRGRDIEPKSFVGQKNQLSGLLTSAAEYIYGACQPSSYSVYLTEHGRSPEAISLASLRYPKAQHLGDRVQLLYAWATALSEQGDHKGAIEKYRLTIDIAPQSWGSYVALQDEYEELGQTQRALDTGRALESRAHRGSWWFEHLPSRLFRHPGPDVYMATDQLTNDYIALKQSIKAELGSREAGAELLPLYSAYAQVLSHLHERSHAQLQLDLAANRKDHGAAEGDLLYAEVVLATEEQDDARLRSILARYRNQILDPASRLSLAIEPDADCELMTAYERTGDTVMSDLLSSLSDDSAECLSKKAELQIVRGNKSQAYTLFQRAIVDAPSLPYPHYDYGLFLLMQGDLRRARMELELAHTTGPHWAEPLEALAKLAVDQGDLASASNLYRQAALCAPSWGNLYISWADALARAGKNDEAAAKLQSAYSMDLSPAEEADLKHVSRSIHLTNP